MTWDKRAHIDKLRGALLLSAYGDALGLPHELEGLQGRLTDPQSLGPLQAAEALPESLFDHPWALWCGRDEVRGRRGLPSDDSATRFCLTQPWLLQSQSLDESDFEAWLAKGSHKGAVPEAVRRAWLEMFQAQRDGRSAHFFEPGEPVLFGLFLYLDLALLRPGDAALVYQRMVRFCALDQRYGGLITGLLGAWISEAMVMEAVASEWSQSALELLSRLIESLSVSDLSDFVESAGDFGRGCRDQSEYEFVRLSAEALFSDQQAPYNQRRRSNKAFDPLLALRQLTAALAYGHDDPLRSLRVLVAGVGDVDTLGSILGLLIGAGLGERRLSVMRCGDALLGEELAVIESNLALLYNIDLNERVNDLLGRSRRGW